MWATPYQSHKHQQAPNKQALSRPIPIPLYTWLGMPKIEFRILEIRNLVGTVFHNCNIFGSVDSKIKRQFTGEKNFAFERNAINARQLCEGRPVAEWWEGNKSQFSLLYNLAAKYLAIPATSASSEHSFSKAGLTIGKLRTRLTG